MKVLRRATKTVYDMSCPICKSRLQAGEEDVEWYVEKKIGRVTCPVCKCEHVPVLPEMYGTDRTLYENEQRDF